MNFNTVVIELYTAVVVLRRLLEEMERMFPDDVAINKTMASHGAEHILNHYKQEPVKVLTHCNTGSLSTTGYGTALGEHSHIVIQGPWPQQDMALLWVSTHTL